MTRNRLAEIRTSNSAVRCFSMLDMVLRASSCIFSKERLNGRGCTCGAGGTRVCDFDDEPDLAFALMPNSFLNLLNIFGAFSTGFSSRVDDNPPSDLYMRLHMGYRRGGGTGFAPLAGITTGGGWIVPFLVPIRKRYPRLLIDLCLLNWTACK